MMATRFCWQSSISSRRASAGMIAPALESLPEDVTADRAALLKRARDVWPDFAEAHGLTLLREGADWRGPDPEAAVARLLALGFEARLTPAGLTTSDDWRMEVAPALKALARTGAPSRRE